MGLAAYFRLVRAGYVLAREGALSIIDPAVLPPGLRFGVRAARLIERGAVKQKGRVERLTRALNRLGPTSETLELATDYRRAGNTPPTEVLAFTGGGPALGGPRREPYGIRPPRRRAAGDAAG